jgi:hypothetical protein
MNKELFSLIGDSISLLFAIIFLISAFCNAYIDNYPRATFDLVLGFALMKSIKEGKK